MDRSSGTYSTSLNQGCNLAFSSLTELAMTVCPACNSWSITYGPIKPVAPVTNTLFMLQ